MLERKKAEFFVTGKQLRRAADLDRGVREGPESVLSVVRPPFEVTRPQKSAYSDISADRSRCHRPAS